MGKLKEWERLGINRVDQLYSGETLKSFAVLREYALPNSLFYTYLQVRHALQAQSRVGLVRGQKIPQLQRLIRAESSKGIISDVLSQTYIQTELGGRYRPNYNCTMGTDTSGRELGATRPVA